MTAAAQTPAKRRSLRPAWLRSPEAPTLIHGPTHRPGAHRLADGLSRVVLSDWDASAQPPRADILRLSASGLQRLAPDGW